MSTVLEQNTVAVPLKKPVCILLFSGDRLDQSEFHHRHKQMPSHLRYELIDGVVYMVSPVIVNSYVMFDASFDDFPRALVEHQSLLGG